MTKLRLVTIENICPDFFAFWEQAKAYSFDEQLHLWQALYESKHRELIESYYQSFPQTQVPERVEQAFDRFGDIVACMQEWVPQIEPLIVRATDNSASLFDITDFVLPYVVMVGWFISDGWSTDSYQGKRTSFVALEEIARKYPTFETRNLETLLTHEAAHSHHYYCNASIWREYHIGEALFLEGFAVFVSARALPGASEAVYLCFQEGHEDWLKACENQWPALREQLLKDFDIAESARYAQYFQGPQKGPFPLRSGYFAGYRAVVALAQHYSLIEMAYWDLVFAAEKLRCVLQEM